MSEEKDKKEQNEELQKRVKAMNEDLLPLLKKHKLALGAIPFYAQTPEGLFVTLAKPQWYDDSKPKAEEKVEKSDIAKAE